jgi:hypothetical protein
VFFASLADLRSTGACVGVGVGVGVTLGEIELPLSSGILKGFKRAARARSRSSDGDGGGEGDTEAEAEWSSSSLSGTTPAPLLVLKYPIAADAVDMMDRLALKPDAVLAGGLWTSSWSWSFTGDVFASK